MNLIEKIQKYFWTLIVLFLALIIQLYSPNFITKMRNSSYDLFQQLHPRVYQPAPVKILAIDNESLEKIGQFPWSRRIIADLIEKLITLEANVIVFDMMFSEKDRTSAAEIAKQLSDYPALAAQLKKLPDNDDILIAAMKKTKIVTGFMLKVGDNVSQNQPSVVVKILNAVP
ncbi:MAG: CHASE2 domain-containing protein [Methylococcales bacterium]|nr:CHASE2 domain-containing protein [Methylococcales bacterium]